MLTSMEGVYRGGRIELLEKPRQIIEETPVIVTFLTVRIFNGFSKDSVQKLAELQVHLATEELTTTDYQMVQGPDTGVNAIFGQWPGEETDAEIRAILEQLS